MLPCSPRWYAEQRYGMVSRYARSIVKLGLFINNRYVTAPINWAKPKKTNTIILPLNSLTSKLGSKGLHSGPLPAFFRNTSLCNETE